MDNISKADNADNDAIQAAQFFAQTREKLDFSLISLCAELCDLEYTFPARLQSTAACRSACSSIRQYVAMMNRFIYYL